MSRRSKADVRKWSVFWKVNPDLVSRIKYAIVCGETDGLFITTDDEVYGVGSNSNGCLGVGDYGRRNEPVRVDSLCGKKIVSIAAGHQPHMLAVTADGKVYAWGDNSYGQLGIGTYSPLYIPQLCQVLEGYKIKQVTCGAAHTLFLTENGEVFASGSNDYGQLGSNGLSSTEDIPHLLESLPSSQCIESVMCGAYTSFALSSGGQLFSWGNNDSGQLGIETNDRKYTPQRVGAHLDIVFQSVACGHSHVLALTHGGRIFAWGHNYFGEVGVGHSQNMSIPTRLTVEDCIFVEVGANQRLHISAAVTHTGKVFAWGKMKEESERKPVLTSFTSIHDVFATLASPTLTCKLLLPLDDEREDASIRTCLRRHLDNEEVSDIVFRVGDQKLNAHASFLRMRSQYVRAMLNSHWSDQREREIAVKGYSYSVFRAFLHYLYTDKLCVEEVDAIELLQLADEYCEKDLKQKCESFILSAVSVENVFAVYAAAKKLSAKELEEFCFNFAIAHLNSATQTEAYESLDKELAKDFLRIAGKRNAFRH